MPTRSCLIRVYLHRHDSYSKAVETFQGIRVRYCTLIQCANGYQYTKGAAGAPSDFVREIDLCAVISDEQHFRKILWA